MLMRKLRIAVATKGRKGLGDVVSEVFGRAQVFTIIDAEEGKIEGVEVVDNPAVSYMHGAGPIVVKMLIDSGVNMVLASEFGPGASTLLDQHHVARVAIKPGKNVKESIRKALKEFENLDTT
jgi:predicted Fe-Mo cluster-binding NifX family protein